MKHSIVLKAIAIILAAVALLAAVCGAAGMLCMAESGLYRKSVEELRREKNDLIVGEVADSLVREYIADNLSHMTDNARRHSSFFDGYDYYYYQFNADLGIEGWAYAIREGGKAVKLDQTPQTGWEEYAYTISSVYPMLLGYVEIREDGTVEAATVWDGSGEAWSTVPTTAPAFSRDYDECMRWYDEEKGCYVDYYFQYVEAPEYQVSVYLPKDYHPYNTNTYWHLLTMLSSLRNVFLPCLLIGLAVFALAMTYLVAAAGHGRDTDEIRAGGLNRIPLDLYTAAAAGGVCLLVLAGAGLIEWFYYEEDLISQPGFDILAALPFLGASFLAVGWLFALAAQFKTGNGFWWRNSVIGRCLRLIGRCCRRLWRLAVRLFGVMHTMWQWLLVGIVLCVGWFFAIMLSHLSGAWVLVMLLMLGATILAVCYAAYAFGLILEGARRMAGGDLNQKISTEMLIGCFADCAGRLNALADVAVVAAQKQLKSERMKTELITNVSHDIKTPLTSIINYVDLLQKPHTENQGEEYLDVLARQSQRMKKLVDDLMDMSKAATGNMTVEMTEMDAVEAVNQALGEFSDKLAAVPLYPVIRCPEEKLMIRGDGRLVWRTLSNLLQNAVKYALPGTRLYVDMACVEGNVVISLKNVSREELNISADELMERFVRGDASRNTEGSGLGLNIARSLMELQKGQLRILVDGDLFKTSLIFPAGDSK